MRWLLLKDLQILRRSPLQAFLLVAYPVLIAAPRRLRDLARTGQAAGRLPQRSPAGRQGHGRRRASCPRSGSSDRICGRVECVDVGSRAEAAEKVRSGDVLAALILPADLVDRLNSLSTLNPETPKSR